MPTSTNTFRRPFIAVAVALACVISTQNIQAAEPASGETMTTGNMMVQCQEMMAHKKQMMADMKTQDTALAEQVEQMNSAANDKKLGLLAALVTRMAEQRIAKNTHMAIMNDKMMNHMMQHMGTGKESMQGCPMMKGMDKNGMNDKNDMNDKKDMKDKKDTKGTNNNPANPVQGQK